MTAGWIQATANGRYFQHQDGTPFYAIGHGEAFGFFFQAMNPRPTLEAFMQHMASTGQNTLLCQVESEDLDFYGGHRLSLEGPLGHYDEEVARQFDALLELAQQNGIYVITYLWDTFHMDFSWDKSPYNVVNGGPCRYVSDMLRDPSARKWQKQKFAWAIDRWGNHPNLFAWELMNEIEWAVSGAVPANAASADDPDAVDMHDPVNNRPGRFRLASAEEMEAWVTDMGQFVRAYGIERWGRAHLQTVSTNNPRYDAEWFYRHKAIDFVTNHQYVWEDNLTTNPAHPLEAALTVRDLVRQSLARSGYTRPYMDTEHGPLGWHLEHPTAFFPFDDALFHHMAWANWAAGAAGGGLRWPYPNYGFGDRPYLNPLSSAMEQVLGAMARISKAVAWTTFASRPADERVHSADDKLLVMASGDDTQMIGWLVVDDRLGARAPAPTHLTLTGFNGPVDVTFYDDQTGTVLARAQTDASVMTPAFERHLAFVARVLA